MMMANRPKAALGGGTVQTRAELPFAAADWAGKFKAWATGEEPVLARPRPDCAVPSLRTVSSSQATSAPGSGLRSITITTARVILLRSFTTGQMTVSVVLPRLAIAPDPRYNVLGRASSSGWQALPGMVLPSAARVGLARMDTANGTGIDVGMVMAFPSGVGDG